MKKYFLNVIRAVAVTAVAALVLFGARVDAQTVTAQPNFAAPRTVVDLGNGPTEIMPLTGSGAVFTAFGTGVGTAPTTTALTLTATPPVAPCVGCFVTCPSPVNCTIAASTTVAAYNGTTLITLSAAATVTAASVNFGTLCPVSTQANPVQPAIGQAMAFLQAGVNDQLQGIPFYTQGRVCMYGGVGPGMQFMNFAIGAH